MGIKKIAVFILICSLCLLAGCEHKENGTINEDGTINYKLENYNIEE